MCYLSSTLWDFELLDTAQLFTSSFWNGIALNVYSLSLRKSVSTLKGLCVYESKDESFDPFSLIWELC